MFKFLKAARSLVNQGMSKEAIEKFAKQEFGEINELFQKQIDNLFKQKQGIENIKIKDEVFDDTVIKLPIDDTGKPFNPRNPLKDYSKELTDSPLDDLKKIIDDFEPMGPTKPRDKKYTGGLVDVEPSLSDIGHGSDAFMARTRLMSPGSQATTSTGLNYLLAEDNDNIRVPFSKGKAVAKGLDYLMDLFKPKPKVIFDEKRFREGPIDLNFLENIDKKDLEPFIRSRDRLGPGGYGMYDDFADMPSGLQAAELISRIKGPRNTINYEAAEMFIGKKLKGNESVDELIEMLIEKKAEGGRIGFAKGKGVDLLRRGFLKTIGAAGAGIAALKTGLLGLGGKQATKEVAKEIITTPAAAGKPAWFDALVTRVVNEGEDVTKKFATKDREIVHATKVDDDAMVTVYRDLDDGTVRVDIDDATTNVMGEQGDSVVSLEVKGGQLEEGVKGKTPVEFEAREADYRNYMDGPDDYTTETIDNVVGDTKDLTADLTKVKMYAKGQKKPTIKEMMIQRDRAKTLKQAEENPAEYAADRGPDIDTKDYDYASGGIARMIGE
jgi:hypothetical protein